MGILNALRVGKLSSRLDPKFAKNVKRLEGIKGDLTPLNIGEIVRRSEVSLTDAQRAELLTELQTSDKFGGSNVEFALQGFQKISSKDKPNLRFLADKQRILDESIHIQVLQDLLAEQPAPGRVNPFPAGLDVAIPIPESQINILGKIQDKIKSPIQVDFTTLKPVKQEPTEVIRVDFTTLKKKETDEEEK